MGSTWGTTLATPTPTLDVYGGSTGGSAGTVLIDGEARTGS